MKDKINSILTNLLTESQLINSIKTLKQGQKKSFLFGNDIRSLSLEEIQKLKEQDNHSDDWSKIKVAPDFKSDFIWHSSFTGDCVLGVFHGKLTEIDKNTSLPGGIFGSTIVHSEIGNGCIVRNNGLISNYLIKEEAVVCGTGSMIATGNCTYGNGIEIPLGIETGGREVLSFAEMNVTVAEQVATQRHDRGFLELYEDFIKKYLEGISFHYGVVESKSIIRNTARIVDAYIGENVLVDGATLIENCTVLGSAEEQTEISHGSYLKNSCVQWGCEVTSMAIVFDSVLTEHSHVERHGKVTASIIGPNTGIGEGEVTSSLVGPFVGFHHQALLIAAIWPEGKGNVAYGANVGSNHTSRAPDQEIFCGEGMFFGLGVNIKFPSDFTGAPYSIIATGVNTLPQKVEFPFSLINSPSRYFNDIPPPLNEIIPAWVLSDNIYTVRRNEGKYKKRNKARRTEFNFDIFRPDIMDKVVAARDRLVNVKTKKDVYIEKDIPGLGKNFMLEEKRRKAIETYHFYLEYYCLSGLRMQIQKLISQNQKPGMSLLYNNQTEDNAWEHQRETLNREGFNQKSLIENLERLMVILEEIEKITFSSKEKDDIRGEKIIRDYGKTYIHAPQDSFIIATREETQEAKEAIQKLISSLSPAH